MKKDPELLRMAASLRKDIIKALLETGLYTKQNVHKASVLKWYR